MATLKKLTFRILCAVLLLSLLPALGYEAKAATVTYAVEGGNLYFDPVQRTITDCDPSVTCVNIPTQINGVAVTRIGASAFEGCTCLTSVTIPDRITTIDRYAFRGCTGLTSVTIPDSVFYIGGSAFRGCTGLTSITLPDSVTRIDDSAFEGCTGLTSITLPDRATSIGSDAFFNTGYYSDESNWDGSAVLYIGNHLIRAKNGISGEYEIRHNTLTIADAAFEGCTGLTSVTISDSVTSITYGAFYGCTGLTSVSIPDSVTSIDAYAFYGCTGLTSVTIPDSVTSIAYSAFYGCTGLTSVSIPDSVTYIGAYAFYGCTGLTSMTIPDSVTSIDAYAFYGCTGLTSVTILDGVTSVGEYAFYGCIGLISVTIPDSVTSIGGSAFRGCTCLTSVSIPDSVTSIGAYTFYDCTGLTSMTIPDSVTSIGERAFYGCTGLTSVTIPDSVTSIAYDAFRSCTGLTSVTIPDSVTSIGERAFRGCTGLTSVRIPDSVTTIADYAFCDCTGLTNIYYTGTEEMWNAIDVGAKNDPLLNANIHFLSDMEMRIYHTLNLGGDIAINYMVLAKDLEDYEDFYMECLLPEYEGNDFVQSSTVRLTGEQRGIFYYFVLDGLVSFEMNNEVQAQLVMHKENRIYLSNVDHYSIATYAYSTMRGENNPDALKAVCANLLQYGAKAQLWKGYRTDALADANMTEAQRSYLTDPQTVTFSNNKSVASSSKFKVSFVGVAMRLDSKIVVRYIVDLSKYRGDLNRLSLHINYKGMDGTNESVVLWELEPYSPSQNYYAFSFDGLLAAELRTVISSVVCEGGTRISGTMNYSVDTYGNDKTGTLLTLVQAMIAYSDAAKAYFAS